MNRAKNISLNIITSIIYQVAAFIAGILIPRMLIYTYGSTYNGVISSITQILSMVSLLTLGIAGATRAALYSALAKNDEETISRIVATNRVYMRFVALIIVGFTATLIAVFPFVSKSSLQFDEIALLIVIIGLGYFIQYFFGNSYVSLLVADGKEYIQSSLNILCTIIYVVATYLLITANTNIILVKLIGVLAYCITPIFITFYTNKRYKLKKYKADFKFLPERRAATFHSVSNIIHDNTDVVVLTFFVDAKVISVYSVYNIVTKGIRAMFTSLTSGIEATLGKYWAKKEYDSFNSFFFSYRYVISFVTVVVFSCAISLIDGFIVLYTDGVTDTVYLLPYYGLVVMLGEAFYSFRQPYNLIVQATGNYKGTKLGAIFEASINLSTSLILAGVLPFFFKNGAIYGVAIGTLVSVLFRTIYFGIFSHKKILFTNYISLFTSILWTFGSMAAISVSLIFIFPLIHVGGWLGWIVDGFIGLGIAIVATSIFSMIFYRNEYFRMLKKIGHIFTKLFHRKKAENHI